MTFLQKWPPRLLGPRQPAWANIAYEVYVAILGLRNASQRLSNASVTLQKRSTHGLYLLIDVFIHFGRFHGQWARRCGALLARVRVCQAAAVCDR